VSPDCSNDTQYDTCHVQILSEDINPTLEKLRGERRAYLEWAKNNTECERLARFCVAYEFVTAMATAKDAAGKQTECATFLKTVQAKIQEMKATITVKEAELKARETERSAAMSGAFKRLIDQEDSLGKSFAQVSAALENQKKGYRDEERAFAVMQKSSAESDAQLAALHAALQKQTAAAQAAHQTASTAASEVQSLMGKYNAASAGLALDDDGMGSTLADQHLASKTKATTLSSEISSTELRIKHLSGTQKDLSKSAKSAAADHAALQGALQKASAGLEAKRAKLAAVSFNPAQDEALRSKRDIISAEVSTLSDKLEPQVAALSSLMEFSYDVSSMGPGFSAASVKGVVARLFSLKDARVATALEIAASGKLYQVVVDNEVVGKQLLEKGKLRRRVTIIPLNKVKRNGISKDKIDLAATISKGTAVPAIQLVDFDESVRAAMEYTFGGFFVCPDAETAKAITFHPKIGVTCVTFDGDMFDPAGTLEGGSKPESGGEPLLLRLAAVSASQQRLLGLRAELRGIEEKIASMSKAASDFAGLASEIELCQHEVSLMQQRVGASQLSATESKLADTLTSIQKEEAQLVGLQRALKETHQRAKDLEAELANVVKAREVQMASLGKQLDAAKKAATAAETTAKKAQHEVDKLSCDFESAKSEKESSLAALKDADASLAAARADMDKATSRCTTLEAQYQKAKTELDAARETIATNDKAMKSILKERDAAKSAIEECDAEVKRTEVKQKTLAKDAVAAEKMVKDLRAGHAWIEGDEEYFGKPHTDYDFAATDPKAASAKLTSLEKKQNELERKINKKVIGMIEQAEREYADLVNKKRIIENDKSKIEVRTTFLTCV
jgi:structural maintenance of chromosome 2